MIRIVITDKSALTALQRLHDSVTDMSPAMSDIGEYVTEMTKRRFSTSTAPDGTRWAPNSEVTIMQYINRSGGAFNYRQGRASKAGPTRKKDSLTDSGIGLLINKKPLIGRTRGSAGLMGTIHYNSGHDFVEIGSPKEYAAMQQFGGKKTVFKNLWGDIPSRKFLGVSDTDRIGILDIIAEYFDQAFKS